MSIKKNDVNSIVSIISLFREKKPTTQVYTDTKKKGKKREALSNSRMPASNCRMSDKIRKSQFCNHQCIVLTDSGKDLQ